MSSSTEHTPAPQAAPHVPAEEQIRQQDIQPIVVFPARVITGFTCRDCHRCQRSAALGWRAMSRAALLPVGAVRLRGARLAA